MDTLPDYEFMEMFDRVSKVVHFGRCRSPQDVKNRIKRILNLLKKGIQNAKKLSTKRKFKTDYHRLRTLYRHKLHERIWEEAERNPRGIVDLTIDYGRDKARKI